MSKEDLSKFLRNFTRSAFRLETLAQYSVPEEEGEFAAFLRGEFLSQTRNVEWAEFVREAVKNGKAMTRVHIVPTVPTPYLRYELEWCYLYSADAGEDIRFIVTDDPDSLLGEPLDDFWLFDDTTCLRMEYGSEGEFLNVHVEEDAAVARYRRWRDTLLKQAEPLRSYLSRLRRG